jgi:hypothetical protein
MIAAPYGGAYEIKYRYGGGEKTMKNDNTKTEDKTDKLFPEVSLAVQEWGIKNNLRLFGIMIGNMDFHCVGGPAENVAFRAKGYFVDPAFKIIERHVFEIKEKSGSVAISKMKGGKGILKGLRWPIKIARTKELNTRFLTTIIPLYWVLVERGLILDFESTMKHKEWAALPFEDGSNIKQIDAKV